MPLTTDDKVLALSEKLIQQFDTLFGMHPGMRPVHAKGLLLTGTFSPSEAASGLSRASHFQNASTPVFARFSNSTGIPLIPDSDPNADPRGLAIRFQTGEHAHTDIIAHSTDGFPTRTGDEFLEFLQAVAAGSPTLEQFVGTHPTVLAFVQTPKPTPASFATELYFGVTAMRFTNAQGVSRYGRYRLVPDAGLAHLSTEQTKTKTANFLFDELQERLKVMPVKFVVQVQLAAEGDVVNDSTIHWPASRELMQLGTVSLTGVAADNAHEQKTIIFDPIPRVDGIDPSDDPLLELRAAVYLISGRRRRKAPEAEPVAQASAALVR